VRFYPLIFLLILVFFTYGTFLGYDIWFHLENGDSIRRTACIPHTNDFLSQQSSSGHYFLNYEWLFGLIVSTLYSSWGINGIHVFRTALILGIFSFLMIPALRSTSSSPEERIWTIATSTGIVFLAFLASISRFEPRPHLLSGFFLAMIPLIGNLPRSRGIPWAFGAGLFWANAHIEVLFGLALVSLSWLEARFLLPGVTKRNISESKTLTKPCETSIENEILQGRIIFPVIFAVAILLSPAGPSLVKQGAEFGGREMAAQAGGFFNIEMVPIGASDLNGPYGVLLVMTFIGMLAWLARPGLRHPGFLGALFFAGLPFLSNRFILPGAIVATIFLLQLLPGLYKLVIGSGQAWSGPFHLLLMAIFPAFCFFSAQTWMNPVRADFSKIRGQGLARTSIYDSRSLYPSAALDFLKKTGLEGNVFCPDRWGNFISWYEDYPAQKNFRPRRPFINGMAQSYPLRLLKDYMRLFNDPKAREILIAQYDLALFLLPYPDDLNDPVIGLAAALVSHLDFGLVYWDDVSVLYARRPAEKMFSRVDPMNFKMMRGEIGSCTNQEALINELERGSDLQPSAVCTPFWVAEIRESQGRFREALAMYENLIASNPEFFPALFKSGVNWYRLGGIGSSAHRLEEAVNLSPKSAPAYFNLAIAQLRLGKQETARNSLETATKIDPGFAPALRLKQLWDTTKGE